jgi:hypothetical protein
MSAAEMDEIERQALLIDDDDNCLSPEGWARFIATAEVRKLFTVTGDLLLYPAGDNEDYWEQLSYLEAAYEDFAAEDAA